MSPLRTAPISKLILTHTLALNITAALLAAPWQAPATAQTQQRAPNTSASAALTPLPPKAQPCPEGVAAKSRCLTGRDNAGADYWLAVPPDWNGTLVVHAHGGPELGVPKADRAAADLTRWSVWTRAGYAYAGSGFRQGGVAVQSAAEDTDRVRQIFIATLGVPKRVVLHGQSWGASVAARTAELFNTLDNGGKNTALPYDAVLLTSGVLGGGSQSYNFRLDLRVVYQVVCGNHPQASEAAYPLWQGLPLASPLSRTDLASRVEACTGLSLKPADRTPAQQRHLQTILAAVKIEERALLGHLNWATWHFQDIVFNRLAGRNPFDNALVRYSAAASGLTGDALNAQVARYTADPAALADFAQDADPQGRISVPVLTLHGIDDPVAFVELESTFKTTMARGGSAASLVQAFTQDTEHSYLSDAQYVTALQRLIEWASGGAKPTPASLAADCPRLASAFEAASGCRFAPQFAPQALSSRVPAR